MEAPAQHISCVPAPMADTVVFEEPGGGWKDVLGAIGNGEAGGGFLQIRIWLFRCCKMVRCDQWYIWMWIFNINVDASLVLYLTNCGWKSKLITLLLSRHSRTMIWANFCYPFVPFFGSDGQKGQWQSILPCHGGIWCCGKKRWAGIRGGDAIQG